VIPRYAPEDLASLFSDEARFGAMLEVELLATEAMERAGTVPPGTAVALRAAAPRVDADFVRAVEEREAVTRHDTAAFVDVVQREMGIPEAAWVHYGLTSSDVIDTALAVQLTRALDVLVADSHRLVAVLAAKARATIDIPVVGRTHGMFAEPTTFGAKFALFCLQASRDEARLRRARDGIAVGKLSGAVGTYSTIDPAIEADVCRALGLVPVPATQVLARDRHAELLYACAATASTIEAFATEVRLLARSEVGEVAEPFAEGQKGSSSMPHKRNPVNAERLCGLARVIRGYLIPGLEDIALWHERDISHSSVERVILPDSIQLTGFVLRSAASLAAGLELDAERAREHLDVTSLGLVYSQSVLLALVASGMTRDDAYRIVQRTAATATKERRPFREVLVEDPDVPLDEPTLARAFDLDRVLASRGRFLEAIEGLG
jgi:adenylosuccinate lyase